MRSRLIVNVLTTDSLNSKDQNGQIVRITRKCRINKIERTTYHYTVGNKSKLGINKQFLKEMLIYLPLQGSVGLVYVTISSRNSYVMSA